MIKRPDTFAGWPRELDTAEPHSPVAPSPDDEETPEETPEETAEETPEDHERPGILNALHGCA
jgi:hypothetical protein